MNTKRIKNALLEMTFHEKFNINKFQSKATEQTNNIKVQKYARIHRQNI